MKVVYKALSIPMSFSHYCMCKCRVTKESMPGALYTTLPFTSFLTCSHTFWYAIPTSLQNIKDVGMACQKVCKQGRDYIIVKVSKAYEHLGVRLLCSLDPNANLIVGLGKNIIHRPEGALHGHQI